MIVLVFRQDSGKAAAQGRVQAIPHPLCMVALRFQGCIYDVAAPGCIGLFAHRLSLQISEISQASHDLTMLLLDLGRLIRR